MTRQHPKQSEHLPLLSFHRQTLNHYSTLAAQLSSGISGLAMMTSSWVTKILNPKKNPLAAMHKEAVSTRLRRYGLRYDDLFDPMEDMDIKEALRRLPQEVVDARNQRLLRAMDLSMKHQYLPDHLQAQQTPFRSYLKDMLALVKRETAEREALGALPLYQRSIP